jgi:hypothetical protein
MVTIDKIMSKRQADTIASLEAALEKCFGGENLAELRALRARYANEQELVVKIRALRKWKTQLTLGDVEESRWPEVVRVDELEAILKVV